MPPLTRDRSREKNLSHKVWGEAVHGRSRISNGRDLLPGIDGRGTYARRLRDLIKAHVNDLGGPMDISAGERSLIQRVSCLTVELEFLEARFARSSGAASEDLQLYCGASSVLNRLLTSLGLRRRPRDVTLDLAQYLDRQSPQPTIDGTPLDPDGASSP
jgi:hypothetical protein